MCVASYDKCSAVIFNNLATLFYSNKHWGKCSSHSCLAYRVLGHIKIYSLSACCEPFYSRKYETLNSWSCARFLLRYFYILHSTSFHLVHHTVQERPVSCVFFLSVLSFSKFVARFTHSQSYFNVEQKPDKNIWRIAKETVKLCVKY